MAQYSTKLSDFVNEEKTRFNDPEDFYEHIDTAKLKNYEKEKAP